MLFVKPEFVLPISEVKSRLYIKNTNSNVKINYLSLKLKCQFEKSYPLMLNSIQVNFSTDCTIPFNFNDLYVWGGVEFTPP